MTQSTDTEQQAESSRLTAAREQAVKFIEVAPGHHIPASTAVRKLEKRIVRLTAQAITDYGMINDGDRVLVAMSGGKDSYALLDALIKLKARAPIDFDILAVHVDQGIPGSPTEKLIEWLKPRGVAFHIEHQDTHAVIERLIPSGKNVCSLCARLRRGILYRIAPELGCNKIALGHQMDDVVSTLLLNLFYGGSIKAMPPVLRSNDGRNIVIRPLIYLREHELAKWAQACGYPLFPKDLCGAAENLQRKEIKQMMAAWDRKYDSRIYNIFKSTTRVASSQLADKALYDFSRFRRLASDAALSTDEEES